MKNGILTVTLPQESIDKLVADGEAHAEITIDLAKQTVTRSNGEVFEFPYNAVHSNMLLNGLDEIGQTLQSEKAIAEFEVKQKQITPWLYGA